MCDWALSLYVLGVIVTVLLCVWCTLDVLLRGLKLSVIGFLLACYGCAIGLSLVCDCSGSEVWLVR